MASDRQRKRKRAQRKHHAAGSTVPPLFAHLMDIIDGRRTMPTSDAKFQHYVPQLHLRGFSPNPRPARNARIWAACWTWKGSPVSSFLRVEL